MCQVPRIAGNQNGFRPVEPDNEEREAEVTTAVAPSSAALTAVDRCDRCGAQAYLRVALASGLELLFFAHPAREHGEKLRDGAVDLHDETQKLHRTPPSERARTPTY